MRAGKLLERGMAGTPARSWHGTGPIEIEARPRSGLSLPVDTVDRKGYIYYLATRTGEWQNPHTQGVVTVSGSSLYSASPGGLESLVDRSDLGLYSDSAPEYQWFAVDLGAGNEFSATHFAARQRTDGTNNLTRQVAVHASNDGTTWDLVGELLYGEMNEGQSDWNEVPIPSPAPYRHYRITNNGNSTSGSNGFFQPSEIELFGNNLADPSPNSLIDGWQLYLDDPLTSFDGFAAGAIGTWSVDERVKATLGGSISQMRALSNTVTPVSTAGYLMECEFEVPVNFVSANDHMCIGWLTSDATGKWVANLRGDNVVVFLQDGTGWSATAAYTHPAAGTWVNIRVLWEASTGIWKLWVDGVLLLTASITQAFDPTMRPTLMWYNDTASTAARFRNLRAWYQTKGVYSTLPAMRTPPPSVVLASESWSSNGFNGVINALGEQLATDMGEAPGTYFNPVAGVPTATPNSPQTTPPTNAVLPSTSQSSNLDAYRLSFRAFDHVITGAGDEATGGEIHTNNVAGSWWAVDFGAGRRIVLSRFGVLGRTGSEHRPLNFKIQGSLDGTSWADLIVVTNDGPGDASWWSAAATSTFAFRHIRLLQTGLNSDVADYLQLGDVEMWGTLYGESLSTAGDPFVVQSATAGSATPGATLTATLGAVPTPGNTLVCVVGSIATMTAGPSGFIERVGFVGQQGHYIYTREVQAGDPVTVTVDPNGDFDTAMVVMEVEGTYVDITATAATQGSAGQTERTTTPDFSLVEVLHLACFTSATGTAPTALNYTQDFVPVNAVAGGAAHAMVAAAYGAGGRFPTASWTNGRTSTAANILTFARR